MMPLLFVLASALILFAPFAALLFGRWKKRSR